jgi:tetratricopeptide (TPR) repeat protein
VTAIERAAKLHAQGVAATGGMDPALGARRLREALAHLGDVEGPDPALRPLRGRILVSLAYAEAEQGNVDLGWQLLAEAEPLLPAEQHGVLHGQRAQMLRRTGRHELALAQHDAAIAALRRVPEPAELARALLNRAVLHIDAARPGRARTDLRECIDIAARHEFGRILPMARHNLAYLDYLAGDLPAALGAYHALAEEYARSRPSLLPVLAIDRARALLAAGLFTEADRQLAAALRRLSRQRPSQDIAEAQLARAEAALLGGRPDEATRWARRAGSGFARRGNRRWAALASVVALRGDHARGVSPARVARRARALADTLRGLGLNEDARVSDLVGVRALVCTGRLAQARDRLTSAGPAKAADRLDTRLLSRLARAELAHAVGRRTEASRHLSSGLSELHRYRSQLGCLDLQTGAAVHGRELATTALRAALATGSVSTVFGWSERARAQALLLPPARPPDDPGVAAALEELRQVRTALRRAELAGRSTRTLTARSNALQRTIREYAWGTAGPGPGGEPLPLGAVEAVLSGAALVIYLRDGPDLWALVTAAGQARLVRLCPYREAAEAVLRLRADLDAQAGRAMPDRLATAVAQATRRDADVLAAAVLSPLLPFVGDRDLLVVPTGELLAVPWSILPGCQGRPLTVAPSATTWYAARARLRALAALPGPVAALLVAGPGNDRGEAEVRAIADLHPTATVLIGPRATPAATLAGMRGTAVAHLAAHGRHEPDNALFASLDLVDGSLMGYDFQGLGQPPVIVVLSSCDLGLTEVRPGDETLGMATALLVAGSSTVIASVSRIADDAAMTVMTAFHQALHRGEPPAAALAGAASAGPATGFVCIGAG